MNTISPVPGTDITAAIVSKDNVQLGVGTYFLNNGTASVTTSGKWIRTVAGTRIVRGWRGNSSSGIKIEAAAKDVEISGPGRFDSDRPMRGIARGGSPTTIMLDLHEAKNATMLLNQVVTLRPGTQSAETGIIRSFDFNSKIATMKAPWNIPPIMGAPYALFGKVNVNAIYVLGKNALVRDCLFSNVDDCVVFTGPGASGTVENISSDDTLRGDQVFIAGAVGVTLNNLKFVGSQAEHGVRVDQCRDAAGHDVNSAANITINGGAFAQLAGNDKECIAVRQAAGPVTVDGAIINNSGPPIPRIRVGQVAKKLADAPKFTVGKFTLKRAKLLGGAYLTICQGVMDFSVDVNEFAGMAGYCPIHFQGPHVRGVVSNNVETGGAGGSFTMRTDLAADDVVTESNNQQRG